MTTNQDDRPTPDMPRRIAVFGHRSFISQELIRQLNCDGRYLVQEMDKRELSSDLSGFDCVYLVLGNSKPLQWQEEKERADLAAFLMNPRRPLRAVYLSSMDLGPHKQACEQMIEGLGTNPLVGNWTNISILRPPAVFGPGQNPIKRMLVPQIVDTDGKLELLTPDRPTWFISVKALGRHLANFADPHWYDGQRCGEPDSLAVIPGSFCVTPMNVLDLYEAFKGLESQKLWRTDY